MIRRDSDGPIAIVTLDRPEKKNALTPTMLDQLTAAIAAVSPNSRVLILTGAGDAFCSGFDLPLCKADEAALPALLRGLSHAIRAMRRLHIPVVACAHGAAIAGGCALLGGADFVITHDDARLGYPVVRLGISPAVTAPALRLTLGDGQTRERLLGGSLMTGKEALAAGLAHECHASAGFARTAALRVAADLAAKPPEALAATKQWLNSVDGSEIDAPFDLALRSSLSCVAGLEQRTMLAALLNRG